MVLAEQKAKKLTGEEFNAILFAETGKRDIKELSLEKVVALETNRFHSIRDFFTKL